MNIIILGGGFGGLTVATRLAPLTSQGHAVTLIDKKDGFQMGLGKVWGLVGVRPPEEGRRFYTALAAKGIRFIQNEVRRIDPSTKTVMTKEKILSYDMLVVAMGAETLPEAVPGLPASANFYDPANIPDLHRQLKQLREGRVAIVVCKSPYKCPPAPFETAMLVQDFLAKQRVKAGVKIRVYIPEERPLMVAGRPAGEHVMKVMEERGMKVETEHKLVKVDAPKQKLYFENGHEHDYNLLLAIPPHAVPNAVKNSGLTDESGWVPVDPTGLATRHPDLYAIGDVTALKLPGGGLLPKAGIFAEAEGEVVADHILAKVGGTSSSRAFDGKGQCYFEAGNGQAMIMQADFFGEPSQRAVIEPPSEEGYRKKQAFEIDRLAKWFS